MPGPAAGHWGLAAGRPGRRIGSSSRSSRTSLLRLELGGTLSPVVVAYETWGELDRARANAVLVAHALTGDSHAAGPAGPGHRLPRLVGPLHRRREGHRHQPVVRGLPQRPRRVPGHDRAVVPRAGRAALREPVPHRSPSGTRWPSRRPWPTPSASSGGRPSSAGRWAGCGPWSGRSATPDRLERAVVVACGAAASAEQIGLCAVQNEAIRADPAWRGGDYYDAGPGEGPHRGMGIARRIGHLSYRSEPELARPLRAGAPARRGRLRAQCRRAVRRRVVSRPPCRQAGPAVRCRDLCRPVGGDEPPRRRAGPGRAGRRARAGAVPGGGGRDRQRPALPAAPPAGAGRAAAGPAGADGDPFDVRARLVPHRVGGRRGLHPGGAGRTAAEERAG